MTNPVTPFRNNLFGSRGIDIKSALDYVDELAMASTEPAAVQTAARVLLNTIDGAVTQAMGPSALEEALFAIIDKRIAVMQINSQVMIDDWMTNNFDLDNYDVDSSIEAWMTLNLRDKVMAIVEDDDIDDQISNWMSNNFDLDNYNVNDAIESWMDNNLDNKITDLDLVVRSR